MRFSREINGKTSLKQCYSVLKYYYNLVLPSQVKYYYKVYRTWICIGLGYPKMA